jgi:hypothetical protein
MVFGPAPVTSPVRDVTCFGYRELAYRVCFPLWGRSARGGAHGHAWLDDAPECAFRADNGHPWRCLAGTFQGTDVLDSIVGYISRNAAQARPEAAF